MSRVAPDGGRTLVTGESLVQRMHLNWASLVAITLIACVVPFFPFYSNVDLDVYRESYAALHSRKVLIMNSVLVGVSAICAFNALGDYFTLNAPISVFFPGLIMSIGVFVNSVVYILLSPSLEPSGWMTLTIACFTSRRLFIYAPLVFFMIEERQNVYQGLLRTFLALLVVAVQIASYPFTKLTSFLNGVIIVTVVLFLAGTVYIGIRGAYVAHRGLEDNTQSNGTKKYGVCFYNCWFGFVLATLITHYSFGRHTWADMEEWETSCFIIIEIVVIAIISTLPQRIAQYDAAIDKDRLNAKKTFVRYISHEIRTPLNVVLVGLQMLERCTADNAEYDQPSAASLCMDSLEACGEAVRILNELLLYDRVEEGSMVLDRTNNVALEDLLQKSIKLFSAHARGLNINLAYEAPVMKTQPLLRSRSSSRGVGTSNSSSVSSFVLDDAEPSHPLGVIQSIDVDVDVNKFSQVIHNLLSNAMKFTKPGGSVRVRCVYYPGRGSMSTGTVHVQVIDTGCGISEENQKKLFKNVIQFDPGKLQNGNGTGLGLWLSYKIMKQHGGTLRVSSDGLHGTTFTAITGARISCYSDGTSGRLQEMEEQLSGADPNESIRPALETEMPPSVCSGIDPAVRSDEMKPVVTSAPMPPLGSVLIVEDSKLNRKMVKVALRNYASVIHEAEDGKQGVECVVKLISNGTPPDVILMDHQMPIMTGAEATRALRDMGYRGRILMLTGHVLPEDVESFIKIGADGVLSKPIIITELLQLLYSSQ